METQFTTRDLVGLFAALSDRMSAERDALCVLDGLIGDADHGIAMQQGMNGAAKSVRDMADVTFHELFNAAAKGFLNAVGASSGPLYATAFMRAGKAAGPHMSMTRNQGKALIVAMSDGISHRGKAVAGQKTMLDAWIPAAEAAQSGQAWREIAAAAQAGADATSPMIATMGRAARLGERSRGHMDPGAASAAMIVQEFAAAFGWTCGRSTGIDS